MSPCLVCGSSCDKTTNLEAQTNVVFLLQNILGVPSTKFVGYLGRWGNPCQWVNLCPLKCHPLISSALHTHKQITELSHKLDEIKGRVVDGIRKSSKAKGKSLSSGIEHELREFIINKPKIDEIEELVEALPYADIDIKLEPEDETGFEAVDGWEIDPDFAKDQEDEDEGDKSEGGMEFLDESGGESVEIESGGGIEGEGGKNSDSEFNAEEEPDSDYDEKPRRRKPATIPNNFSVTMETNSEGKFICSICPKTFTLRKSFQRHQNLAHNIYFQKSRRKETAEDRASKEPSANSSETMEITSDGNFSCRLCPKVFSLRKSLLRHQNIIHNLYFLKPNEKVPNFSETMERRSDGKFGCRLCPKIFIIRDSLRKHQNVSHKLFFKKQPPAERQREINQDKEANAKSSKPKPETNIEDEVESKECLECSQTFPSNLAARNHKLAFHTEPEYSGKVINRVDYLQLVKDVELSPWKCSECFRWFSNDGLRDEHQRAEHNKYFSDEDLQFPCDQCEFRRYLSQAELSLHKELAHGGSGLEESEAKFSCQICPSRFVEASRLEFHLGHVHGILTNPNKAKVFGVCPICGLGSPNADNFHSHVKYHRGLRRFLCELCSETFTTNRYLETHKTRAHGDSEPAKNPFGCGPCNRIFNSKNYLQRHMDTVHEKKFKFICHICGAGRTSQSAINQHLLSHQEKRGYCCKQCGAKYKNRIGLSSHMILKHSGKKIPCTFCGKEFSNNADVARHEDAIHKKKPKFKCENCSKTFPVLDYYRYHRKRCHGNKTNCDS